MVVDCVCNRRKVVVVEVERETSVDVDHFTVGYIRTRVARENPGRTLPWFALSTPFAPRASYGQCMYVLPGLKYNDESNAISPQSFSLLDNVYLIAC